MFNRNRILFKLFSVIWFFLFSTACTAVGSTGLTTDEAIPITVCLSSMSFSRAGIEYARHHNLFDKYGLEVEIVDISGGTDAATVLAAGQADICQISGPAVINAALAGADLTIIGGLINQQLYSLVGAKGVQSAADLQGSVVGVSEPGGSSDAILHLGLEILGLDPEKDVTIISVGAQPQRMAALEAGSLAATVITIPESGRAKALGFPILLSPQEMNIPHQHTAIVTTISALNEDREIALRFMKALSEAIVGMQADRQGTLSLMADVLLLDEQEDAPFLDEAYEEIILLIMDPSLQPSSEGVQRLIEVGKSENPTALDLNSEDIIDTSIIDELQSSGFLDGLRE